ncbi:MAG: ribosomal subunit interface protein [Candidatus Moranbacteria bacterium RIFCSPHIGHO2_02_FULL_40_12b]|nr:MAG: ribosomal subunit interface protein [Candidatus Moranbacteria bacterium RIFCSPHIGHO2_02_FULL_40_12b]
MTIENMSNMRLFFKGLKIDERTENYIRKRLATIEKILHKILRVEVEIDLDKKGKFRVEVMVKTPYNLYRAENTTSSIEGSIDTVEDELKNQIRKDKEKMRDLRKRGRRSIKKRVVIDENARF